MSIEVSPIEIQCLHWAHGILSQAIKTPRGQEMVPAVEMLRQLIERAEFAAKFKPAPPEGLPLNVSDWLQERLDNCHRLAAQRTGKDRAARGRVRLALGDSRSTCGDCAARCGVRLRLGDGGRTAGNATAR